MQKLLDELNDINNLISEDTNAALKALDAFAQKNAPVKQKYVAAKIDLLRLIIASVFSKFDKQGIDDKKLLNYFEREGKYDDAAMVLLSRARHHFTHSEPAEGEKQLKYVEAHLLNRISLRPEIVYLTRIAFILGLNAAYDEKMAVSLQALDKLKANNDGSIWHYNIYTVFIANVADCYYRSYDFDKALPYLQEAIAIAEGQNISTYNRFNIYSITAQYYRHKGECLNAVVWLDKIIELLKNDNNYLTQYVQAHVTAAREFYTLFTKAGKRQTALKKHYLQKQTEYLAPVETIMKSEASPGQTDIYSYSKSQLLQQMMKYSEVAPYIKRGIAISKKYNHVGALTEWFTLAHQVYLDWGRQKGDIHKIIKAYYFQKEANALDIINSAQTNQQKLEAVKTRFQLREKEQEEIILKKSLEVADEELKSITLNLTEKIFLLDDLKAYVQLLRKKKNLPPGQLMQLLLQKIGAVKISEQDKALLLRKIAIGNRDFYALISAQYPSLSTQEVQICGLLKTGITSKELAQLFGLNKRSYDMQRYRIKKKMNLKPETNLVKHLMDIGSKAR